MPESEAAYATDYFAMGGYAEFVWPAYGILRPSQSLEWCCGRCCALAHWNGRRTNCVATGVAEHEPEAPTPDL